MIPDKIRGATTIYGPPVDWNPSTQGECADLPVRVADGMYQSAWKPTPEELAVLNEGGVVVLTVWGHQPVVALDAEHQTESENVSA